MTDLHNSKHTISRNTCTCFLWENKNASSIVLILLKPGIKGNDQQLIPPLVDQLPLWGAAELGGNNHIPFPTRSINLKPFPGGPWPWTTQGSLQPSLSSDIIML